MASIFENKEVGICDISSKNKTFYKRVASILRNELILCIIMRIFLQRSGFFIWRLYINIWEYFYKEVASLFEDFTKRTLKI